MSIFEFVLLFWACCSLGVAYLLYQEGPEGFEYLMESLLNEVNWQARQDGKEEVKDKHREAAKKVMFWVIVGLGPFIIIPYLLEEYMGGE